MDQSNHFPPDSTLLYLGDREARCEGGGEAVLRGWMASSSSWSQDSIHPILSYFDKLILYSGLVGTYLPTQYE
jgi:hypothetical protein